MRKKSNLGNDTDEISHLMCIIFILVTGEKIGGLSHQDLPNYYESFDIRGDGLALAGWRQKNVLLFKTLGNKL